jgi:uncharacterized protein involved in exopolysaccharide biosynthesis
LAELSRLETELADLLRDYAEVHPDVLAKRREIEALKARIKLDGDTQQAITEGRTQPEPGNGQESAEIAAAMDDIEQLQNEERHIRRDIAEYQRRIAATPGVEQRLADLTRGTEVLQEKYREYDRKLQSAKAAQRIEESRQGALFELRELAVPPLRPVSPNPPMVLVMGIVAGIALFVGPLVGRYLLRPVIFTESALRSLSDVPVLVSIPRIPGPTTDQRVRRRRIKNLTWSVLSVVVLVIWVVLERVEAL